MTIPIKNPDEQNKMRIAGRLAADALDMIEEFVQPGISTAELDRICHDFITNEQGAIPAPLNYRGFPKSICTSINHVVCHGIPGCLLYTSQSPRDATLSRMPSSA